MDLIQEAVEYIESREPGDDFSYNKVAAQFGVERSTLARRHQGVHSRRGVSHQSLHPEHEAELVRYIKTLTKRRLPPTKVMVQQFASQLAGKPVFESWVSRFLRSHPNHLISRLGKAMAKERTKADSGAKYNLYLQNSQGLLNLTQGDFFPLFWRAWVNVFKPPLIKRSFEATSIYPANPDVVLKKFPKEASDSDSSQSVLSGEDWLKLKSIVRREVKGQGSKDVKKLQRSLCHIAAQNSDQSSPSTSSLMRTRFTMGEPNCGRLGARDRRASQQQQAELEKLQKAKQAEIKKAARDCEAQLKAAKRVERERRADEKRKEEAAKQAEKQHQ
ncbi:pogo transposable [Alternaria alternata]|nr:pogo transposable [Alternaria alternata]